MTNDQLGTNGVTSLTNGNYVVRYYLWDNGATTNVGAVTWCDGTTGRTGYIDVTNSLVGSTAGDQVGYMGITALTNGNYVVNSPFWDNGTTVNAGAATWCDGTTGRTGAVSTANSLTGSSTSDAVGQGSLHCLMVIMCEQLLME
ncbi:MAG: hypothetical protein IPM85_06175 [Chitinophagaceae bacterium]|nr:hypothetical protein [Chitinophagaceae bacterium]